MGVTNVMQCDYCMISMHANIGLVTCKYVGASWPAPYVFMMDSWFP